MVTMVLGKAWLCHAVQSAHWPMVMGHSAHGPGARPTQEDRVDLPTALCPRLHPPFSSTLWGLPMKQEKASSVPQARHRRVDGATCCRWQICPEDVAVCAV